jgi:hypothetical protein
MVSKGGIVMTENYVCEFEQVVIGRESARLNRSVQKVQLLDASRMTL